MPAPSRGAAQRACRALWVLATGGLVVWADLASKHWARQKAAEPLDLLPGFLSAALTCNTGASFGVLAGCSALLAALSGLAMLAIVMLWWWHWWQSPWSSAGTGLLLGGATGNLLDRLRLGCVIDFLRFEWVPWWPAFNLADVATVVGVGLIAVVLLRARGGPGEAGSS
jgi:signal peptidase II